MAVALGTNIANPISTALSQWLGFDTMGKLENYGKLGAASDPDAVITALFANSEGGVFYDTSDLTTMFQDRVGTTQVTADSQTVGLILDKSKGLVLGDEAVTNGIFSADTGWTKGAGATISGGKANLSLTGTSYPLYQNTAAIQSGGWFRLTVTISGYVSGFIKPYIGVPSNDVLNIVANGTYTYTIKNTGGGTELGMFAGTGVFVGQVDDFSIKPLPGNHAVLTNCVLKSHHSGQYFIDMSSANSTFEAENFAATKNFYYCVGAVFTNYLGYQGLFNVRNQSDTLDILQDYTSSASQTKTVNLAQYDPSALYVPEFSARPYVGQRFVFFGHNKHPDSLTFGSFYAGSASESVSKTPKDFVPATGTLQVMRGYAEQKSSCHLYGFIMVCSDVAEENIQPTVDWMKTKSIITPAPFFVPRDEASFDVFEDVASYDSFGFGLQAANGTYLYFCRRGLSHTSDYGAIHKWTYSEGSWSSASLVDTSYDCTNAAGGLAANGDIVLFYGEYEFSPSTWIGIRCIRSSNNGATWSAPYSIDTRSMTDYSAYGPITRLPSGRLVQSIYGWAGATCKSWVIFSEDNGATWGNPVDIYSGTTFYNETAVCYLSGSTDESSKLLAIARNEAGSLTQFTSSDGGATWSNAGTLLFNSPVNGKQVSPWLYHDGANIHLVYADRNRGQIMYATGVADDIFADKSSWFEPETISRAFAPEPLDYGYPSFYKDTNGDVVLQYYDAVYPGTPNIFTSK